MPAGHRPFPLVGPCERKDLLYCSTASYPFLNPRYCVGIMLSTAVASSRGRIFLSAVSRSSASCAGSISANLQQEVPITGMSTSGVRWHSSETNASKSKCPITGTTGRDHSTLTASAEADATTDTSSSNHPTLQKVPSMPIFGSFFSAVPLIGEKLSEFHGVPVLKADNAYDHYPLMRQKYGDFYQICIPGQGKGPRGETVVLTDPHEMLKVLRNEGGHPRGGVEGLWPFQAWARSRGMTLAGTGDKSDVDGLGFFGRGDTWRRLRTFLQTDLLSPQAARGYVAGVAEAATVASTAAPLHASAGTLNDFLNRAAFDMFSAIFFGHSSRVADPDTPTDPEDAAFCSAAVNSLALLIEHLFDLRQGLLIKAGVETDLHKSFVKEMDIVHSIAKAKIERFIERYDRDELNDIEKASYLARAIERFRAEDSTVSAEEFKDICVLLLNASVDTTSTFIAWLVVHLSVNPNVQQKLYEEVKANIEQEGGMLTAEMLTKKRSPYLHATMRESHRKTPVHPTTLTKSNSESPVTVHGLEFEAGSVFTFDQHSAGMDPSIINEPHVFSPERWLPEGLEAAKGTPAEMLDHPFYRDPFSQGARRCPGSRVAINETLAILAKLVLDYEIKAPANVETYRDYEYKQMTLLVPQLPKLELTRRAH